MTVGSEDSFIAAIPAWPADQLDSLSPPQPAPAYFDTNLNAWVLSRYADILAAFRASSLFPASWNSAKPAEPIPSCVHLKMRAETTEALPASRIGANQELARGGSCRHPPISRAGSRRSRPSRSS